jgi:hypothetical protein
VIVQALARYPVKSLLGESLDQLALDERGVIGDRWWALRTPSGRFGSGKTTRRFTRMDRLLDMSARLGDTACLIRLPDGTEVPIGDPRLDQMVSKIVAQQVMVVPEREVPHHDAAPIHIVTTAGLRWLGTPDWQRCRPNIVIDVPGTERVEDDWIGKQFTIATARLEIIDLAERCVTIESRHGEHPARRGLLRSLAGHDVTFGAYARVITPGAIGIGDPVT